jgi:predicted P-loop ATPase
MTTNVVDFIEKAPKFRKNFESGVGEMLDSHQEREQVCFKDETVTSGSSGEYYSKGKETDTIITKVKRYLNETYDFRYNEVRLVPEFKLKESDEYKDFDSFDENDIYVYLKEEGIRITQTDLKAILRSRTFAPHYHPLRLYFESLHKWNEEIDYFEKLASYLKFESQSEKNRFIHHLKKHFVRIVKQSVEYGTRYFNKQCFVIVGNQSDGKTSLIRWFVPEKLGSKYYNENLNPSNKDDLIALSQCMISNFDELASLSKHDITQLKSFFTKGSIYARHPYAEKATDCKRHASFFGSTNEEQFLSDTTGSVRWIAFVITQKINFAYSQEMKVDDLYSQAYTLYKSGFACDLTAKEEKENEEINQRFYLDNDDIDTIRRFLRKGNESDEFYTATEIVEYLSERNPRIKFNSRNIGKALKKAGFIRKSVRKEEDSVYGYYLKFKEEHPDISSQDFEPLKSFLNKLEIGSFPLTDLHNHYNSTYTPKLSVFDMVHYLKNEIINEKVPRMELKANDTILQVFTVF